VASANQARPEPLTTFTCTFKGNTLIDIQPPRAGPGLPAVRREHYKQAQAPLVEVTRTVTNKQIDV